MRYIIALGMVKMVFMKPVRVVAESGGLAVCSRSLAGMTSSNSNGDMDISLL